jgi:hypothetical protein
MKESNTQIRFVIVNRYGMRMADGLSDTYASAIAQIASAVQGVDCESWTTWIIYAWRVVDGVPEDPEMYRISHRRKLVRCSTVIRPRWEGCLVGIHAL